MTSGDIACNIILMDLYEALSRVGRIKELADDDRGLGDPERAHEAEDALHRDFIRWVAETETVTGAATHAADIAKAVLKSEDIEFSRWYA